MVESSVVKQNENLSIKCNVDRHALAFAFAQCEYYVSCT